MTPDRQWRELYKLFDPKARLENQDQDIYVDRPGTVAGRVLDDLREELEPEGKWVLCGSMGSGKSSELVHLATNLAQERMVIGVDLPRTIAGLDQVRPSEILFLIGLAALRVHQELGQAPAPEVARQLQEAFHGLSERKQPPDLSEMLQGVALFAANLAVPNPLAPIGMVTGGARAVGALVAKKVVSIGGTTRPVRDDEPELDRLRQAVNGALGLVHDSKGRPPVVLVDGLDKVFEAKVTRSLFVSSRALCMPSAPVVYTAPITLMVNTEWAATGTAFVRERLTNVAVRPGPFPWAQISAERVGAGRAALRQVLSRRLDRLHLKEEQVFASGVPDHLIDASGGLLRDLIHLVNRAVRAALRAGAPQIDASLAEEAVVDLRREYEITLNTQRVNELRHVREHGEPSGSDIALDLLLTGYILPYSNGKVWYEPHPILRGLRPGL